MTKGRGATSEVAMPLDVDSLCNTLGISKKFLWYLILHRDSLYTHIKIPKKVGYRSVYNPDPRLKFVQRRVVTRLLSKIAMPSHVGAYVRGRSCRDTAVQHTGCELIISMDLREFFDNTTGSQIYRTLTKLSCPKPVSSLIADLCTLKSGKVPQGAPSSGDVCNVVANFGMDKKIMKTLRKLSNTTVSLKHEDIRRLAKQHRVNESVYYGDSVKHGDAYEVYFPEAEWVYTRYSDDIDISTGIPVPRICVDWVMHSVQKEIRRSGYRVNHRKTKVERRSKRQIVLGMVVNEHPNIPRSRYLKYRALIHNCLQNGFDAEAPRAGYNTGVQLAMHIEGMLNYFGQVNPAKRDNLLPGFILAKEEHDNQLMI